MKIRQHIPNFVSDVEPATANFGTLNELLSLPFVAAWRSDARFDRFSISRESLPDHHHLMCEMTDGTFWVVGFIDDISQLSMLPSWRDPHMPQRNVP